MSVILVAVISKVMDTLMMHSDFFAYPFIVRGYGLD